MAIREGLSRRAFVCSAVAGALSLQNCASRQASAPAADEYAWREALKGRLEEARIEYRLPGLAAGLFRNGARLWSGAFGFADIEAKRPMGPGTIQNYGSLTKAVTATAALQLWESGQLDLDADINGYLGFPIRNPRFPDAPITTRQLLTHRSSIRDSAAYRDSLRCGDQTRSSAEFLRAVFEPRLADASFHDWRPGAADPPQSPRPYSNVAYGVIGLLVEEIAQTPFERYCDENILSPLGMASSGFRLADVDRGNHTRPYALLPEDFDASRMGGKLLELSRYAPDERPPAPGRPWPFCLYSFAISANGLLRTSVDDFWPFVAMWAGAASFGVLRPGTLSMALRAGRDGGMMLAWRKRSTFFSSDEPLPGGPLICHDGADPGVAAFAGFRRRAKEGVILNVNRDYEDRYVDPILKILLRALANAPR